MSFTVKLSALEVQIRCEAIDLGISDLRPIEERDQLHDHDERKNVQVDLAHEALLQFRVHDILEGSIIGDVGDGGDGLLGGRNSVRHDCSGRHALT